MYPQYRFGDIVACYGKSNSSEKSNINSHLVIGWVENIIGDPDYYYGIRWSDRQDESLIYIREDAMPPFIELIKSIRRGELGYIL